MSGAVDVASPERGHAGHHPPERQHRQQSGRPPVRQRRHVRHHRWRHRQRRQRRVQLQQQHQCGRRPEDGVADVPAGRRRPDRQQDRSRLHRWRGSAGLRRPQSRQQPDHVPHLRAQRRSLGRDQRAHQRHLPRAEWPPGAFHGYRARPDRRAVHGLQRRRMYGDQRQSVHRHGHHAHRRGFEHRVRRAGCGLRRQQCARRAGRERDQLRLRPVPLRDAARRQRRYGAQLLQRGACRNGPQYIRQRGRRADLDPHAR